MRPRDPRRLIERDRGALDRPMREVMTRSPKTIDPDALEALAKTAQVLAALLNSEARVGLLGLARSGLGTARTAGEAGAWAGIYGMVLPREPTECVNAIVRILKYPTAALQAGNTGEPNDATSHLMGRLDDACLGGKEAPTGNLVDVITWVAERYPEIETE